MLTKRGSYQYNF